jgi:alpha-galactosidase
MIAFISPTFWRGTRVWLGSLICLTATTAIAAAENTKPSPVMINVAQLQQAQILKDAAAALQQAPITITKYHAKLSPGGPREYYSNGDYWWPNPNTSNGLPYIRRDGLSNPNNFNQDRECIRRLRDAVAALGAAYKITGDDRYVTKAVELLNVFFLDPNKRMNPNLRYAQAVPGVAEGRSYGIIDTLHLIGVPKAIEAMDQSPAFPPEVLAGLKKWFADYVHWMRTSKNGREEADAKNNHSVAYWLQVAVFAQFVGDDQLLAECRQRFKEDFVPKQMAPNGSFPRELARTKPYGYSIFQLDNMATLCQVLSTTNDDLWTFTLPDGRGMRKAMEFLYPYLADKSKWLADGHRQDVQAWNSWPAQEPSLLFAGLAYHVQKYLDLWERLGIPTNEEVRRNLAIRQPILWLNDSTKTADASDIRTPPAPPAPRINGPDIFGVRPDHPFLYHIPATGDRPMTFSVANLPAGLRVNQETGEITGQLDKPGDYMVTLRAKNSLGADAKQFKIVVGETIALTPPMGWNSWNCWGSHVDEQKVLEVAKAMVSSGLINHGWTYINIDDSWQGWRGGPFHALQGNKKFPDMKKLCDEVHTLGLKIGIYSTPWVTSYAGYPGGSSENPEGAWTKPTGPKRVNRNILPWAIGKYHFDTNDADQWAAWGVDYLKYDWNPIELPETVEMYDALRHSGRDIVFSLSNNLNIKNAPAISKVANSWRTTGDIRDNWYSVTGNGFASQNRWAKYSSPGHWNDPDMLVVGQVGWGHPHPTGLTPNEQYSHITLWCLLAAPLLLGCDMNHLDSFTLNLLENDEVLAVDQDSLGKQATRVAEYGQPVTITEIRRGRSNRHRELEPFQIWARPLADGSHAVGLFNLSDKTAPVTVKWSELQITGKHEVRDLWRQKNLGEFEGSFSMPVGPHGAELVKIEP